MEIQLISNLSFKVDDNLWYNKNSAKCLRGQREYNWFSVVQSSTRYSPHANLLCNPFVISKQLNKISTSIHAKFISKISFFIVIVM